jgi:hypothetical protein
MDLVRGAATVESVKRAIPLLLAATSCSARLVPVVPDGVKDEGTSAAASDPSFEVVARTAGVKDPLPVDGASVAYADLESALGQAVIRAVRPRHDHTLTVELIAADASYAHTRLAVSLVARATLRTHEGNAFVTQTQVVCRDAALTSPEAGASVVWSCMTRLGRDLGGWLDGVKQ